MHKDTLDLIEGLNRAADPDITDEQLELVRCLYESFNYGKSITAKKEIEFFVGLFDGAEVSSPEARERISQVMTSYGYDLERRLTLKKERVLSTVV